MKSCNGNVELQNQEQAVYLDTLYEIGSILKKERENKSLSLKDINKITCIPLHHLLAIEEGKQKKLPEPVFIRGFITKYAKVLGLNLESLLERYFVEISFKRRTSYNKKKSASFTPATNAEARMFKVYHLYFAIVCVLFTTCVCLFFFQRANSFHATASLF